MGSANPSKVNAVRLAWRLVGDAEILGVPVDTGVPPQPVGLGQVLQGALLRALKAKEKLRAEYGVGIEAGIIPVPSSSGYLDLQAAVIVGEEDMASVGLSSGFEIPSEWVSRLLYDEAELEDVAVEASGVPRIGERIGVIGWLTSGTVTRLDLSLQAVTMALVPWLRRDIYGPLIKASKLLEALRIQP